MDNDKHSAYDLELSFNFKSLMIKNLTFDCNRGVKAMSNASSNATLIVGTLLYKDKFHCNITGIVAADVAPEEDISPVIRYIYYSTPSSRPAGSVYYDFTSQAKTLVSPINTTITTSNNAERMLAGQDLSFTIKLRIPECLTKLVLKVQLPVVSIEGTPFARKRRSVIDSSKRFVNYEQ